MNFLNKCWSLTKSSFGIFTENHPVKFASAIAYFSLFALPSMFLILLYVLSLYFSEAEVLMELKAQLREIVGSDGAEILVVITENYKDQAEESIWSLMMYIVIIFWLSTQLFRLFQNSLNDLWRIKPKYENFWRRIWVERGLTFLLVIGTGLLFFSSVVVERAVEYAGMIVGGLDTDTWIIKWIINILTAIFVFLWFSLLYKVLPAVRIKWEPTFVGAAVTSVLFFIGIWLLWEFVVERDLEGLYDKVASIILVALWIFYSSLVFLFGASFTKAYASMQGKQISPARYAYKFKITRDDDFHE